MPSKKKRTKKATNPKNAPSKKTKDLLDVMLEQLDSYLNDLDCINEAFLVVDPVLAEKDKARMDEVQALAKKLSAKTTTEGMTGEKYEQAMAIMSHLKRLSRGHMLYRNNSLISLVSRFDDFIGDLVRGIHKQYPDRLKSSEKTLSYEELTSLTNLDQAVDRLIDKEVDRALRDSHSAQVKYLEAQLGIQFRDKLAVWPEFIELTERRNLLVHCGGTVSSQYLRVCSSNDCKISPKTKAGSQLHVSPEYFNRCHAVLVEVGLKLGQAVLRKLFPEKLRPIDSAINNYGVELLSNARWDLALMIFDFACNLPPKLVSDDFLKRVFAINKSIALKFSGNSAACNALLDSMDWTSSSSAFTLAVAVLKDDFEKAGKKMSGMDGKDPISEPDFKTWPLFREFRKSDEFKKAFKKIYGRDFEPREEVKKAAGELQDCSDAPTSTQPSM